jgi:GT2 family glycosyltransferase
VIANHSTDGPVSVLVPDPPDVASGRLLYLRLGQGDGGLPFGAAALRAGQTAPGDVVVLMSGEVDADLVDLASVVSLLAESDHVGAVVPLVLRQDGSVAEAGATADRNGDLGSCGDGESPRRSEHRFRRVVDGTRFGCAAIRRSVLAESVLDPEIDDPAAVVAALLAQVRSDGRDVMFEPGWSVMLVSESPGESGSRQPSWFAVPDAHVTQRTLVVIGSLSGWLSPWADDNVMALLNALVAEHPRGRLVVASAEGSSDDELADCLRAAGIEVEVGPSDWQRWFGDRAYYFSHVVVTDAALRCGLAHYALNTQPQCAKILWAATLPEVSHQDQARIAAITQATRLLRRFDQIWCANFDDQRTLSGLLPDLPVRWVPRPIDALAGEPHGYFDRSGLVVMAMRGADVLSAHEDAAVVACEEIFTRLRRHDTRLHLSVVTDGPSPMVERLAKQPGVELVPPGFDGGLACLGRARVLLAPYRHGLGGPAAMWAALTTLTPMVTTPHGAQGFLGGELAALSVADSPLTMAERAWELYSDPDTWDRHRNAIERTVSSEHGISRFRAQVREAFLEFGVATDATADRTPNVPSLWPCAPRGRIITQLNVAAPALRVGDVRPRKQLSVPEGLEEKEAYHLWCKSRGPTPAAVEELRTVVAGLAYHPKISVITPVYNTDAFVLEETIASVRDQVYGNWELCLADDGSTKPETKVVLERIARDPRFKITYLPGQSGISGASNAALAMATGDYVTMLDHDDLLKPHALAQVVRWLNRDPTLDVLYSDEDKLNEAGELVQPFFKPDWSPNLLMSENYVCHLLVVRRSVMEKVGGFRSDFDGSQDYDLVLRLGDETDRIAHIPEPLYSWRIVAGSVAADLDAKPYAYVAAKHGLRDALVRRRKTGTVVDGTFKGVYRTEYAIPGRPRVAIIIPTRDKVEFLRKCVDSIVMKSTYRNFELVVVDNDSTEPATLRYLASFPGQVLPFPGPFNYARMMNYAAHAVECDALLFLNNDTEVINEDWLECLLGHAMRPEVGAVGCRLYFPDGRIQHEGVFVGVMSAAANVDHGGYWGHGDMVKDFSAVTGACVMIRPGVYWAVGGNDEHLRVAWNDVDLCLRIRQAGFQVVYTPYARLFHFEGASRSGYEHDDDKGTFTARWRQDEEGDPFYNPNFDRWRLFRLAL